MTTVFGVRLVILAMPGAPHQCGVTDHISVRLPTIPVWGYRRYQVKILVGAYDSVLHPVTSVIIFGGVLPLVIAVGWCVLLWFFAGMIIYVAIVCVIAFEVILSAYLCYKSGWTESLDTGILVEFGSGIAHTSNPRQPSSNPDPNLAHPNPNPNPDQASPTPPTPSVP